MGPRQAAVREAESGMYICICNAVTDRQIRDVVDRGARSLFDVQCRLPVGSCCGTCKDSAEQVVDQHLRSKQQLATA